jgi:hypothetical protein
MHNHRSESLCAVADDTASIGQADLAHIYALEGLAAIAAAQGAGERAARLWGAAEALREQTSLPKDALVNQDYERWMAAARTRFDAATFAAAWAAGRALTLEQAIAAALDIKV